MQVNHMDEEDIAKYKIIKLGEALENLEIHLPSLATVLRFNYRSCGNPICISAPHCTECGLHGSTMKDGHDCVPKRINFE
jgi:hypothetical protein